VSLLLVKRRRLYTTGIGENYVDVAGGSAPKLAAVEEIAFVRLTRTRTSMPSNDGPLLVTLRARRPSS
jgi:hypothetical protein